MIIYNGCNHPVRFFKMQHENFGLITKERGGKFIAVGKASYFFQIPKEIPLEAPHDGKDTGTLYSFLPNWTKFDLILCSKFYADFAIVHFSDQYPEYVDRLFTVVPIFKSDAETMIGCVGVKKVCKPLKNASDYFEDFCGMGKRKNPANIPLLASEIAFREEQPKHDCMLKYRHRDLARMLSERGIDQFLNDFVPQGQGTTLFCA